MSMENNKIVNYLKLILPDYEKFERKCRILKFYEKGMIYGKNT